MFGFFEDLLVGALTIDTKLHEISTHVNTAVNEAIDTVTYSVKPSKKTEEAKQEQKAPVVPAPAQTATATPVQATAVPAQTVAPAQTTAPITNTMNDIGNVLADIMKNADPEVTKQVEAGLVEAVKELRGIAEEIQRQKLNPIPVVSPTPVVTAIDENGEKVINNMNFDNFQQGVSYQPVDPQNINVPNGTEVTPEHLEEAISKEKSN